MITNEVEKEVMESRTVPQADAHLDRLLMSTDLEEPWYKSIARSIHEHFHPPQLPPLEITSKPVEGVDMGGMGAIDVPWYKSFVSNVRDLIHPPKLPPLEVTSKPVEVKTIWGAYQGAEKKSGTVSVLIHVGIVVLLLVIFQAPAVRNAIKKGEIIYLPAFRPKLPPATEKMSGGGGGGQKMPQPVSRGVAPKPALKPFVPPAPAVPETRSARCSHDYRASPANRC